jgi:hypothetical protein
MLVSGVQIVGHPIDEILDGSVVTSKRSHVPSEASEYFKRTENIAGVKVSHILCGSSIDYRAVNPLLANYGRRICVSKLSCPTSVAACTSKWMKDFQLEFLLKLIPDITLARHHQD